MIKFFRPSYFSYAASQFRKHGWSLLQTRYFLRRKILSAAPMSCPADASLEVHTQVCERDWLNALWALRSFRHHVGQSFRLVLHQESLSNRALQILKRHFPGSVIASETGTEEEIRNCWKSLYPTLVDLRFAGKFFTLPKVVDSHFLARNDLYYTIDPDVLFFAKPVELLETSRTEQKKAACFNVLRNVKEGSLGCYAFDEQTLADEFSIKLDADFGIGCGWVRRDLCDWEFVEAVLKKLPLIAGREFMMDQSVPALWASRTGYHALNKFKYTIEPVHSLEGVISRHYYSKTRDLMYIEGMQALARQGILRQWHMGNYDGNKNGR